jgi:hypothetical protein
MHELLNDWISMRITPGEFLRSNAIGKRTVPSSIKDISDDQLTCKLNKVGSSSISV